MDRVHADRPARSESLVFQQLVSTSSSDQLATLGIPAPGHPYWTADVVEEFSLMYSGLDVAPWLEALG